VRGALAALVVSAALLAAAAPAGAADGGPCFGDTTGTFPPPVPGAPRLTFGIYPGGRAGQVFGPPAATVPDRPRRTLAALDMLRGDRELAVHLYVEFTNRPDMRRRLAQVSRRIRRYGRRGYEIEYVLAYRPQGRRGEPDVRDFAAFARRFVRRFGDRRGLTGIQVTNEANNFLSPDASDGAYPGARDALVRGLLAADAALRRRGLRHLELGFNWFYRLDPSYEEEFWRELRAKGGRRFVRAVDWVGVDVYPGTYFPPTGVPRDGSVLNAISTLRECYLPLAGLAKRPIHVTENGWPTGPGRTPEEQAVALEEMVRAVNRYRGTYGVTDYRWFDLRDADSSSASFQQQYGLLRDDYTPKPAFDVYRRLIARLGGRVAAA
jgi:hypothetical protein